MTNVIHWSRVV